MNRKAIAECMRACVEQHLAALHGTAPAESLHDLFMGAAERPLLEVVLERTAGNQSRAAEWLGINRNTLRRKLREHRLVR